MNASKALSLRPGCGCSSSSRAELGWMWLFGGDVCPSCPVHLHLLEPGTAVPVTCPCRSFHRSAGRVGTEGQGKSPWHSCRHNSLEGPAGAHSEAPLRARDERRTVPRSPGWGDKGSPNLRLPALTKSLIIFKFGEWMPWPAIIHLLCC